jgi:hypothetical protein
MCLSGWVVGGYVGNEKLVSIHGNIDMKSDVLLYLQPIHIYPSAIFDAFTAMKIQLVVFRMEAARFSKTLVSYHVTMSHTTHKTTI